MKDTIEVDGVTYRKERQPSDVVVVRTESAGVHVGELVEKNSDGTCTLSNAVRIWRWYGARTLSEMASNGILPASKGSRVSEPVEQIDLRGWIEIIPTTIAARDSVYSAGWKE